MTPCTAAAAAAAAATSQLRPARTRCLQQAPCAQSSCKARGAVPSAAQRLAHPDPCTSYACCEAARPGPRGPPTTAGQHLGPGAGQASHSSTQRRGPCPRMAPVPMTLPPASLSSLDSWNSLRSSTPTASRVVICWALPFSFL